MMYTHVTTTKETTSKVHSYRVSLHMKSFSTSNGKSLMSAESTTSKDRKADTSDVPMVAIVIPIVGIIIGVLVVTIFLYKRRWKAILAKTDCNAPFHGSLGIAEHANGSNVMEITNIDL